MQRHIHPPGVSERSQVSPSVVGECVEVGKLDELCDLLADMISEGVIHLLNMLYPFLEEEGVCVCRVGHCLEQLLRCMHAYCKGQISSGGNAERSILGLC
jgi:hypothetical protein